MRLVIETSGGNNNIIKKINKKVQSIKEANKKAKPNADTMQDDVDYIVLISEWNLKRQLEGKPLYQPEGMKDDIFFMMKSTVESKYHELKKEK